MVSKNRPVGCRCDVNFCSRISRLIPVDVFLHEQVETIVKVAPHVRIEMDPANALWVRGENIPKHFG